MCLKGGGKVKLDYIKITDGKSGVMHGGNQSDFCRKICRSGCGMIAACDMLLYKQGRKALSHGEYKQFISEQESFFYGFHFTFIGVTACRIIRFLRRQGFSFRFVPQYRLKGTALEQLISEALEKDTPVIVRVGLNRKKLPYRLFYTVSGRISQGMMSWHYITVTGMENGTLYYSSWGAIGEMPVSHLQEHMGFLGGIIIPKN